MVCLFIHEKVQAEVVFELSICRLVDSIHCTLSLREKKLMQLLILLSQYMGSKERAKDAPKFPVAVHALAGMLRSSINCTVNYGCVYISGHVCLFARWKDLEPSPAQETSIIGSLS